MCEMSMLTICTAHTTHNNQSTGLETAHGLSQRHCGLKGDIRTASGCAACGSLS